MRLCFKKTRNESVFLWAPQFIGVVSFISLHRKFSIITFNISIALCLDVRSSDAGSRVVCVSIGCQILIVGADKMSDGL